MDNVRKFVRDAWKAGAREKDYEAQAEKFLREALASEDPEEILFEPVCFMVRAILHSLAVEGDKEMGSWEQEKPAEAEEEAAAEAPVATKASRVRKAATRAGKPRTVGTATPLQLRQLKEFVNVRDAKGNWHNIPWGDVTVPLIDATIAHHAKSISGITESVRRLTSARERIIAAGVRRLRDCPEFKKSKAA